MAAVIPAVTKISSKIIRVLGCNPAPLTLQGTNTYIVGSARRRILIDTGDASVPQFIKNLKQVLTEENAHLAHICITHWHNDHIGGLPDIFNNLADRTSDCRVWKFPSKKDEHEHINAVNIEPLKDGLELQVEGATLRTLHTPGNTDDHVAFHYLDDNAIFSGDCILGEGTSAFDDLSIYMNTLRRIAKLKPDVIYPGHGNIINNPLERIEYYLLHRMKREKQIIDILDSNKPNALSPSDFVKLLYTDLPDNLTKAAESNVKRHLIKLMREDRVQQDGNRWQMKL